MRFLAGSASFVMVSGCILPGVALMERNDGSGGFVGGGPSPDAGMDADVPASRGGRSAVSEPQIGAISGSGAPPVMAAAGDSSAAHGGTGPAGGVTASAAGVNGRDASVVAGAAGMGTEASPNHGVPAAGALGGPAFPAPEFAFATWPMPDALAGSQTKPSYSTTEETVIDNVTHLVWQRNIPPIYDGCTGQYAADSQPGDSCTWEEAYEYCTRPSTAAALGGGGWRMPTKIELESIVDETHYQPAIDTASFHMPVTTQPYAGFWTASPKARLPAGWVWVIDFAEGGGGGWQTFRAGFVRCVR